MTPASPKRSTPDVHAVRSMFACLGLPVCDDAAAIAEARDAQRATKNRQLNSTKGSVAVAAQAWFESVDSLLNQRPQLLEGLFTEFSALADALLVMAGAAGRKRLSGRVRTELASLAERWLGAREDLAQTWVDRWLSERGRSLPADTGGEGGGSVSPERRKRLVLAMGGALAVVAALGGLYHSVGLGPDPQALAAVAEDGTGEATTSAGDPALAAATTSAAADALEAEQSLTPEDATPAPSEGLVTAVHSPNVAFGGHRLVIAIQTQAPVTAELLNAQFEGATLHDVRRVSGGVAVELAVNKPAHDAPGLARWSFQLTDEDGRPSSPVSGSCKVLPGGW